MFGIDPVSILAGAALKLLGKVATSAADRWWSAHQSRVAFERAIAGALNEFSSTHRGLSDAFFDKTFLKRGAAPLLAEFFTTRGNLPTADRLLRAWEIRYGLDGHRWPELPQAASDFLDALSAWLGRDALFQPLLDRRAWDATAISTAATVAEVQGLREDLQRVRIEDSLVLLRKSARSYEAVATTVGSQEGDPQDLAAPARDLYRDGEQQLRGLQYDALDQIRDQFDELVASRFGELIIAVAESRQSAPAVRALKRGVDEFIDLTFQLAP